MECHDSTGKSSSMTEPNRRFERWARLFLIMTAITTGWFIPEFYDWTGADQSRPAPIVPRIAIAIVALDLVAIGILVWKFFREPSSRPHEMQGNRFGIRHILVATAVIAFLSAIGKFASLNIATSILLAMVWLLNIGLAIAKPNLRWQIITIGICQIGPLLWTFRGQGVPIFNWRILGIATSLPSFLPTLLISSAFRQHFETYQWLATLFTTAELGIGVWLSNRAPKLAIVVMLLVLTQSLFGSFILNALIRM